MIQDIFKKTALNGFFIFSGLILAYICWIVGTLFLFISFFLFPLPYILAVLLLFFPFILVFLLTKKSKKKILKFWKQLSLIFLLFLFYLILIENGINQWILVAGGSLILILLKKFKKKKEYFLSFLISLLILLPLAVILSLPVSISSPSKMLAIWSPFQNFPSPFFFHQIIDFPWRIKQLNANAVALARTFNVRDDRFYILPLEKIFLMLRAKFLKVNGIYFQYNLEIAIFNKKGPHQSFKKNFESSKKLRERLKKIIIENAKLAQRIGADSFVPFIEAEIIIGPENSSQFFSELIGEIKKVYKGKVVWWGAFKGGTLKDAGKINFSDYDVICFSHSPYMESEKMPKKAHKKEIKKAIDFLGKVAKKWKTDLMICEVSLFEGGVTEEYVNDVYIDLLFSQSREKVKGIFVLDFIDFPFLKYLKKFREDATLFMNLWGSRTLEKVKEWYQKF